MSGVWGPAKLLIPVSVACALVAAVAAMALWPAATLVEGAPPAKPASLNNFDVVLADSGPASTATVQHARAVCPDGTGVISGGFGVSTSGIEAYVVIDNHPAPAFTVVAPPDPPVTTNHSWAVSIRRTDGGLDAWSVVAYAVCVEVVES